MRQDNSWFERNPKKTLFIFLSVFFVAMIFVTEAYFAYNRPINTPKIRYIKLREWPIFTNIKLVPDDTYLKNTDTLVKKEYLLRTDEDGFIEPSKIYENPEISIVFLGGSTTACLYVEEKKRFPYLVGRIIEKKLNKKVNSYNAGYFGNNSIHSIDILLNKIIPIEPNVVIMEHNINDLVILTYAGSYWNAPPPRAIIAEMDYNLPYIILKKIKDRTFPNLYFQMRKNIVIDGLIRRGGRILRGTNIDDEWAMIRGRKVKIDKESFINDFTSSLQTFVDICKNWDIQPVLMTQANRLTENPDNVILTAIKEWQRTEGINYKEFKEAFDLFNETIKEVARRNNILLIDLASNIPHEKEYMYDGVHFNDNGCQFAAEIIGEELLKILDKE